ncbi:MAG: type II toxin-antitoxin system RelE/ParE family toxin [Geminicoccaceae bacterium]
MEVREYVDADGHNAFANWFHQLNAVAATRVKRALARMEQGNLSNAKGVGSAVFERRIDFGPGYRIYFGKDGETLIILLAGGTKKRQERDIEAAKALWQECRQRKRREK